MNHFSGTGILSERSNLDLNGSNIVIFLSLKYLLCLKFMSSYIHLGLFDLESLLYFIP